MKTAQSTYPGIAPDPARCFIPVELDRLRVLAFDNEATFLVFHKYGDDFFHALYEPDPNAPKPAKGEPTKFRIHSREVFEYFLWAALQRDARAAGESLTLEDVAEQILPTTISTLAIALLVALS